MAYNTPLPERNAKIISMWNRGAKYPRICKKLKLKTRNVVAGVLTRARNRGVEIRADDRPHHAAKPRPPEAETKLRRRRAATPYLSAGLPASVVPAGSTGTLNGLLRKARSQRTMEELCGYLPSGPKQCRWLEGDYLEGTLCACKRDRTHKDTPLADDPFPYCEEHRERVVRKVNPLPIRRVTLNPRYALAYGV